MHSINPLPQLTICTEQYLAYASTMHGVFFLDCEKPNHTLGWIMWHQP